LLQIILWDVDWISCEKRRENLVILARYFEHNQSFVRSTSSPSGR
jgi:hypothetical protein